MGQFVADEESIMLIVMWIVAILFTLLIISFGITCFSKEAALSIFLTLLLVITMFVGCYSFKYLLQYYGYIQ